MNPVYLHREIETESRGNLEKQQLAGLQQSVAAALNTPFYGERLKHAGIHNAGEIKSLADVRKVPFTSKDDLRSAFPYGMLACNLKDVVRLHASSGTTGTPTVIYHTKNDIGSWTGLAARSMMCTGVTEEDVFQNMMTYGLFTGGLGLHYGAEHLGALVIPASSGNKNGSLS